jgi:multidrug efflux pump subunit AcrA (membrane-fusion protein)
MKKNKIITIVIIVLLVVGGAAAIIKAKKKDASAPIAKVYNVVVSTKNVKSGNVSLTLPYLAVAMNDKDVMLASKIPARVDYIKPSSSIVKKGEIIAKLDKTSISSNISSLKAQIKAANTGLSNLQKTHERTLELLKVDGASIEQSQMEESKISELTAKKESLDQKLNELYNMMSYAEIKSPVNGNISKTMVNVGDMAMPGHPIANLRADNGFYLLVRVPTNLKIGAVVIDNKSYQAIPLNSTFHGLFEYKVYADLQNMVSGDRIEVNVEIFNGNAILLPYDAVLNRNGKSFVLLKEGNHAKPMEVNIIETGEQGIAVRNQDLEGKEIIVEKQDILLKLLSGISLKAKEE